LSSIKIGDILINAQLTKIRNYKMELKEYWQIIVRDKKTFFLIIALSIFTSVAYFVLRPESYNVSMLFNITRNGSQQTADYRYDDFYRLQADEKFAETIVQWLKDPRIATDIYQGAGINVEKLSLRQRAKLLKAEKLSSQIISVNFSMASEDQGRKVAEITAGTVSKNVASLNDGQNEDSWFRIIAQDPIIIKNEGNIWTIIIFPLLFGIFIGFWAVMLRHYLR
jgi:capsular polysaccharide biosynthesis protein